MNTKIEVPAAIKVASSRTQPLKVLISGNCTTVPIAHMVETFVPYAEVSTLQVEATNENYESTMLPALSDKHLWLHQGSWEPHLPTSEVAVLKIPYLNFAGFHPDATYALSDAGKVIPWMGEYHSAIALWCWRNGLSQTQTRKMYSKDVFSALKFSQYWPWSVQSLSNEFNRCDLDFQKYWRHMKRRGVFMHTMNHPNLTAIAQLVRLLLDKLSLPNVNLNFEAERYRSDPLTQFGVWALYPSVGESLGYHGEFRWRLKGQTITSVGDFVELAWDEYSRANLKHFKCPRIDETSYSDALTPIWKAGK